MRILWNADRSNVGKDPQKSEKNFSFSGNETRQTIILIRYQLSISPPENAHKHSHTRFNPSYPEGCASGPGILGLVSRGFYSRVVIQPLRSREGGRGKEAERRTGRRPSGATGRGVTPRSHRQLGAQLLSVCAFSLQVFWDHSDAAELKCSGLLAFVWF